jgi:transposase
VNNQVCPAHLIRDVQYAIDAGDDIFAPELRHLLGRACWIGRRRERLADTTLKTNAARLNTRLDELMRLAPTHEAGAKLQRMIKRTRQYLFVFVINRNSSLKLACFWTGAIRAAPSPFSSACAPTAMAF